MTSLQLQARSADLHASPAGLLGRFAPSGFALASRSLRSRTFRASRSQKFFEKNKCVSIDSKYSETHRNAKKKKIYPFDRLRASRVAQSASGEAQPHLPHVTCRVPRSVHAKFHADWTKTVGARGIHTKYNPIRRIQ